MSVSKVHFSTLFLFLVSFTSLFHHCQSLPLWASITFAFGFLFFTIATPPTASALWHFFFPSGGLRPAVAVWFELFQVFLQQQREIVMVLAGCVRTNSWGMWFTKQRVRKCWKLTEYILYIYSIKEKKKCIGHQPSSFNSEYICFACPNQFQERFGHWWAGLLVSNQKDIFPNSTYWVELRESLARCRWWMSLLPCFATVTINPLWRSQFDIFNVTP